MIPMIPNKPEGVIWTDDQWRAIYLEGKNIIISAGAGSGKTAVLTERIIEKLRKGVSIDQMIILTFTNAAAFEMKERVRKKIKKAAAKDKNLEEQVYLVDQATITTFDSFALSLVKKYHYILGLPKDIGVIDNVLLTIEKNRLIDEIFDNSYNDPEFLKMLEQYTIKDDNQMKKKVIAIYDKLDGICKKEEYLKTYLNTYYDDSKINENIDTYILKLRKTSDTIMQLIESIKNIVDDEKLVEFIYKMEETLINLDYAKTYNQYKKVIDNYKFPSLPRGKSIDEEQKEEMKGYFEKLKNYYKELVSLLCYESIEEMKTEILETKKYVTVMLHIFEELESKLFKFKVSKNAYQFSDITRLAIKLLEENEDIREIIKNRTNEIMIDEYQDTNDIGDYFVSLVSNNNVYMVGDVKQSIYRFRNANPKIFMTKYNDYQSGEKGYAIDLNKNFRSRFEVLEGINMMFERIMDENIGGANYSEGHKMIYGNKTYINEGLTEQDYKLEILNYDSTGKDFKKDELEAFIIAEDIINRINAKEQVFNMDDKELRDITYKDFVILIDRRSTFDLFRKVFDYKGIPLIVHKDDEFVYASEIYVLKNILKLINMKKNHNYEELSFAFLAVARSFVCQYKDEDIFAAVTNRNILYNPLFNDFFIKISDLANYSKKVGLSDLLLEVYRRFSFYEQGIKTGNIESINNKLDYLVNVASSLETTGYNLNDFVLYFDEVFKTKLDIQFSLKKDMSSNSVNIMTIHQSKGLEYPICYFPNLGKKFNRDDMKEKFVFDNNLGIVIPINKDGLKETMYKQILIDNNIKEDVAERLRVLYVALTRAKEKMIMVNPILDIESNNLPFNNGLVNELERLKYNNFQDILVSLREELRPFVRTVMPSPTKDYLIRKTVKYENELSVQTKLKTKEYIPNVIKTVKTNFSHAREEISDSKNINFGLLIHETFEYIDFNNVESDIKKYEVDNFIASKLRNLMKQEFMQIKNSRYFKEYAFSIDNKIGIIDLLIETETELIIVDYKLKNIKNNHYVDQLNGYANYLKTISDKKISAYLYSILDGKSNKVI